MKKTMSVIISILFLILLSLYIIHLIETKKHDKIYALNKDESVQFQNNHHMNFQNAYELVIQYEKNQNNQYSPFICNGGIIVEGEFFFPYRQVFISKGLPVKGYFVNPSTKQVRWIDESYRKFYFRHGGLVDNWTEIKEKYSCRSH